MVGLCGVLARDGADAGHLADDLYVTGRETARALAGDGFDVRGAFHPVTREGGPARTADDDLTVLVWGEPFGYLDSDSTYVPRRESHPDHTSAEYVAALYCRHGRDAFAGLNGRFAATIHDAAAGTVTLVTDRLASRPLFWTRASDGAVVFSTNVHSLARDPEVTPEFDLDYLGEYFAHRRAFGLRTPLAGVEKLPPATTTTIDLADGDRSVNRYWYPRYRPVDRPIEEIADEFVERFRAAVADRTADDLRYGVLLSGGTDSRLLLAACEETADTTAYHMTDWMSEESRVAERVAMTAGADFEILWRDRDYQAEALERNPQLCNFVGAFDGGHATGFADRLREGADVVFTAHFADTFFGAHHVPRRELTVPGLGSFDLPIWADTDSPEAYVDHWAAETPSYFDAPRPLRDVIQSELRLGPDGVDYHGVEYDSFEDLSFAGGYYPWTNAIPFFQYSADQVVPRRNPIMDVRLIDLHLTIPRRYFLRENVVGRALTRAFPDQARIPHAETGVRLDRPFALQYAGFLWQDLRRSHLPGNEPPAPHLGHGPWPNNVALVRETDFVGEALQTNRDAIEALPFLEWDAVWRTYREHLNGADRKQELFTLLTLLEMPVTEAVLAAERSNRESAAQVE